MPSVLNVSIKKFITQVNGDEKELSLVMHYLGKYNIHKNHNQVFTNYPYGYGFKFYWLLKFQLHLWNLLKLGQNPYWTNVVFSWYSEITFKILKRNPINSIRIPFRSFNYVLIGHKLFDKWKKKSFRKDFWKQGPILMLQKFITTIWLRFHKIIFHI
jgi:aryl-phospho-beta-D-glucosidase BglC (GH1 family)